MQANHYSVVVARIYDVIRLLLYMSSFSLLSPSKTLLSTARIGARQTLVNHDDASGFSNPLVRHMTTCFTMITATSSQSLEEGKEKKRLRSSSTLLPTDQMLDAQQLAH